MANWADLPADMISELTFYLKGDEYDRFRAVCKGWRERTEERAPQLILMNFAENDNTINALAFFIKPVQESDWGSVRLGKQPSDILSMDGGFYVNFDGVLSLVDIENEKVLDKHLSLAGLSRELSSDPSLSLIKKAFSIFS